MGRCGEGSSAQTRLLGAGPPREALSSVWSSLPDRRADQAGETEAHHVLLQPAALPGPGELHRGAAQRAPGAELRPWRQCRQEEGAGRAGPGVALELEEGYLDAWSRDFCAWDGAGLCPAGSGIPGPSRSLPFCTVGPAAISGPSDQAPVSPFHPGTRLCAPLKMDSVSCSEAPTGGSTAGGRGLGLGTCRSSVCLRSIPWTWVTTSPQFVGRIPRVLPGGPSLAGRAGASRAEPRLVAGPGGEARTHALPGWRELGRAQLSRGHPVPFTQASVGRRH